MAGNDTPDFCLATESALDAVVLFAGFSVAAEGLFAIRLVGNDGSGAAIFLPLPQLGAIVGSVGGMERRRYIASAIGWIFVFKNLVFSGVKEFMGQQLTSSDDVFEKYHIQNFVKQLLC